MAERRSRSRDRAGAIASDTAPGIDGSIDAAGSAAKIATSDDGGAARSAVARARTIGSDPIVFVIDPVVADSGRYMAPEQVRGE